MYDNRKIGEKPQLEYYTVNNVDMVRVPYEITEVSPGIYSWRELRVRYRNLNYGGLVCALIDMRYSPSEMTALINNYLLDPEDAAINAEFMEMQEHRMYAKDVAKEIIKEFNL